MQNTGKRVTAMAYVPPPPGSTTAGEPTPDGVRKQDVHITDLPPEVRKSFLLSMVFFPSLVGAAICLALFLGWVTLFKPKEPAQYAQELESPDMRRRWTAAREMSEHISPVNTEDNPRIYVPETLTALIKIMENPDLDKETDTWSPSGSIRQDDEKGSLRAWAAMMTGHVGAILPLPADRDRAYSALAKGLDDKELTLFAARGMAYLRDSRAIDALARHVNDDADAGHRWAAAEALGSIGWAQMQSKDGTDGADKVRLALKNAYAVENSKPKRDDTLLDNLAIALARVKDSTALERLHALEKHAEPSVRDQARRALEILEK